MEFEKLSRRPWGKGRGKKSFKEREANHKRLLNTENKQGWWGWGKRGKWVTGIEEGNFWNEHWVLCVSDESWESTPEARSTLYTPYTSCIANLTVNYILKTWFLFRCFLTLLLHFFLNNSFIEIQVMYHKIHPVEATVQWGLVSHRAVKPSPRSCLITASSPPKSSHTH